MVNVRHGLGPSTSTRVDQSGATGRPKYGP